MIALPLHAPCGLEGSGDVAPDLSAICAVRRRWVRHRITDQLSPADLPGCGALTVLDPRTGVRVVSRVPGQADSVNLNARAVVGWPDKRGEPRDVCTVDGARPGTGGPTR